MGGVRKAWLAIVTGVAVAVAGGIAPVSAQSIKIGDINSYSRIPAFTQPYRNGLDLAVEEINRAGGVLGRDLEIISRDDGGTPAQAVTAAGELVSRHGAAVLVGTFFSNVGLAVSDFAKQRKVLFLASEPLTDAIVWEQGHRYVYRLRPSTTMQAAMLADQAAKLPAVRQYIDLSPYILPITIVILISLFMVQSRGTAKVAAFWGAALGYTVQDVAPGFSMATHPDGALPNLLFIKVPEPRTVKNRMHMDVSADNREAEVDRLIGLGATRGETHEMPEYHVKWTVMQDPEGNELCVGQEGEI